MKGKINYVKKRISYVDLKTKYPLEDQNGKKWQRYVYALRYDKELRQIRREGILKNNPLLAGWTKCWVGTWNNSMYAILKRAGYQVRRCEMSLPAGAGILLLRDENDPSNNQKYKFEVV